MIEEYSKGQCDWSRGTVVGKETEEVVWDATQGQQRSLDFILSSIRRHGGIVKREEIRSDLCFMLYVTLAVLGSVGARVEARRPIKTLLQKPRRWFLY